MMHHKLLLILPCLLINLLLAAQDTTYYNHNGDRVAADAAEYFWVLYKNQDDSNRVIAKKFLLDGKISAEYHYSNYTQRTYDGTVREYYPNGTLRRDALYRHDKKEGLYKTWWPNGQLKRADTYRQDTLLEGKCFATTGNDTTWFDLYTAPSYPGGMDSLRAYLFRSLRYPRNARLSGIEGQVMVEFYIDKDGTVIMPRIVSSVDKELDTEALRVVQEMPEWIPGKSDGEPVKFHYRLPVVFRLG